VAVAADDVGVFLTREEGAQLVALALEGRFQVIGQIVCLLLATIALWMGLSCGVHMGYGAWQGLPDPGDKAYADGAKLTGAFMFGWMPAGIVCSAVWGFLLLGKKLFG
jgi:hypothetical protein